MTKTAKMSVQHLLGGGRAWAVALPVVVGWVLAGVYSGLGAPWGLLRPAVC
ncbi:hypothetical protein T484DRAFT_1814142 [Baffinella frigidus]|nr:hypothetical protein T484DRAFT_1814142 [Cryptophyta sp. CCMP2293]